MRSLTLHLRILITILVVLGISVTADLRAEDATDEALVRASTFKLDEPAFA